MPSVIASVAAALVLLSLALPARSAMTLTEALTRAAARDPSVGATRAAFAAEVEAGEQERSSLRPSVSATGTGSFRHTNASYAFGQNKDDYPTWSAILEARQPLLRLDWSARGDRAQAQDALARSRLRDSEIQFISRVCQRFLDTLRAQDELAQSESEAAAVRESLADTRKRYEVELVPGTDLKEAMARDDLTQARLVAARAQLEDRRDALQELMEYDRSPLALLMEELPPVPMVTGSVDEWLGMMGENNPSLAAAQLRVAIAKADLRSRQAEALPAVDLVAALQHDDSKEYDMLGQRLNDARVGVELKVPLYAGGYNTSRVNEARARVEEAEFQLQGLRFESERTVRKSFRDVATALASSGAYSRALESAVAAEAAVRAGYDAGTRTISDVLDARSRVVQARRDRNASRYEVVIRSLLLKANVGTLGADDIGRVDSLFDYSASPP